VTEDEIEKHFQQSCQLRDEFWESVGAVDADVIGHLINPAFMGGPRCPSMRQAFITVRRGQSTIVASDGLSDPFGAVDETPASDCGNGFGLEFYVETPGNLGSVKESWQFDLVYEMSQNAAYSGDFRPLLQKLKYLTSELYDVRVPQEFHADEGRTGVLIGLESKTVPAQVALSLETVFVVNVKLLTVRETPICC